MSALLNPQRTVAELRELRGFTADENGAQRVAFAPRWTQPRAWLREKLETLPFDNDLIALCDEAIRETCGKVHHLPSGPLHDTAEVAAAGVPTVMMFVQSLHGISHSRIEDTKEEHLELCVTAFDKQAEKTMDWLQAQS